LRSATAPGSLARPAGTAIFEFPGGVELKDAFKARIDEVGAGLGEADVQAVSPLACCGEPPDLPQTFETAAAASLGLQRCFVVPHVHNPSSPTSRCPSLTVACFPPPHARAPSGRQLLDEQIAAFELNIAIMREFRVGLLPRLRMPLRLLPPRYWAAAAALLLAAVAALAVRRGA
jgi:hypothetical protein